MGIKDSVAMAAVSNAVGTQAPGWEYKVLVNGADHADAPSGFARIGSLRMTNDTIIHVASMSKPVCATAYVAMLDDWTDLANGVNGTGPLAATIVVAVHSGPPPTQPQLPSFAGTQVPLWLVPTLFSAPLAARLVSFGLLNLNTVPQALKATVNAVASNAAWCSMAAAPDLGVSRVPVVPAEIQPLPGYAGLLAQIIQGVAAPQPQETFVPYVQPTLVNTAATLGVPYQVGSGMASVTIGQLITHTSTIPEFFPTADRSFVNPKLLPFINPVQPANGGPTTCEIWPYLLAFVSQPANGQTGYKNSDYTVLGQVITACVDMDYDDYVYARLFSDPKFGALRRYVTDAPYSALYYTGVGPKFPLGIPFPDYRGFWACGGFYYTANQITQWMYALYSGANVQRATGSSSLSGPLVSPTGCNSKLFGTTGYFSFGDLFTASNYPIASGWTGYFHNGDTTVPQPSMVGVRSGSCGGDMGIAVGPNGDVVTAFFCANGVLADTNAPFNDALNAILP